MGVWPGTDFDRGLRGAEGVLLSIRIAVEPRLLEHLLEALAEVAFPINPEIHHDTALPGGNPVSAVVEFPAYEGRLEEVRSALARHGFDPRLARVASMLDEIKAPHAQRWLS